jgi:hypothetical protein
MWYFFVQRFKSNQFFVSKKGGGIMKKVFLRAVFIGVSFLFLTWCLCQAAHANPLISVAPVSVNLGNIPVGDTSASKTVTITNKGTSDLSVDSVTITGTNASEFSQISGCTTIPAKGSCTVSVTFTPEIPYVKKSAVMSIASNDPKKPTVNVKLSGQAPPPKISASPMSVNFGSVPVGSTSSPKIVTVKNTGTSALTINGIFITGVNAGEFSQTHDCSVLAKGEACSISVTFNPATAGKKTALVNIPSNDPKKPNVTVKLSGTGPGSAPVPIPAIQKAKNLVADLRNTVLSIYNYEGVGVTGIFNTPFLNLSDEMNTKIEPELINTVQRIQWIIDSASYINPGDTQSFDFYQDSIRHTLTMTLSGDGRNAVFTIRDGTGNQIDSGQLIINDPDQPTTGSFNASMETTNGTLVASLNYAATVSNGSYTTMSFTGSLIAPGLSIDFSQSGRSLSGKFARVPGSTDPSDIYPTDIYLSGQIQTTTTELDGTLHVSPIVWNAISDQFFPEDASFEGSFNELQNGIPTGVIFTGNLSGSWSNANTFNTEIDESPSNFPRWEASFDGEIKAPSRPTITASLGVSQTSYNTLSLTIGYTRRNIDGTEIYLRGNGSYHLDIELLTANLVNQDGMKVFFSVDGNKSGDGSFTGQITAAGGGKVADLYTISGVPMVKYIDGYIESVL